VAKSTGFLAALSQFSLAALSQQVPNKMLDRDRVGRPRPCDTDEHSTSLSIPRLRAGRGPRGGGGSAPTEVICRRPKKPARVLFSSQRRHCPRADPGPIAGTPARGVRPVIGVQLCWPGVSVEVGG
jgi:hypothetical protein